MTRKGKIARLPRPVREQLNRRLDDGEQGKALVAWLNGLPEVRDKLKQDFHGNPINEQNLSEWRQGGFQDWLRHQEAREAAQASTEEALELTEDAGPMPLSETFSPTVALLMARLVREAVRSAGTGGNEQSTPAERKELLALIREWTAVRASDQRAARLKMDLATWTTIQARHAAADKKRTEQEILAGRSPAPALASRPDWLKFRTSQSDSIKPNQLKSNQEKGRP